MTMVSVTPTEISVTCDPFNGRPHTIRFGADVQRIVRIERVRDESAAYPTEIGPRTLFDVRTPATRLRLCFQHRTRRWLLDGLDTETLLLPSAA